MSKSILTEGIAGRIAQMVFKGLGKKLATKAKNDPKLKKAIKDFDIASKKLDDVIKKRAANRKKAGLDRGY